MRLLKNDATVLVISFDQSVDRETRAFIDAQGLTDRVYVYDAILYGPDREVLDSLGGIVALDVAEAVAVAEDNGLVAEVVWLSDSWGQ